MIAFLIGHFVHTPPLLVVIRAPAAIWHLLPFVAQLVLIVSLGILQFAGIFWFISAAGWTSTTRRHQTRLSDVWGQDHVLERVKENIIFLENPELVRSEVVTCRAACCCGDRQGPER